MVLESGCKLLVCHRRLFIDDPLRFFLGVVVASELGIAKVTGFTWTRDPTHGFQRKPDRRTKLIAVASGSLIVYEIPGNVDGEALCVEQPGGHVVVVTDGAKFRMDMSERL